MSVLTAIRINPIVVCCWQRICVTVVDSCFNGEAAITTTGMQTSILWTGIENQSLENCEVSSNDNGSEIRSVVIGTHDRKNFKVDYLIHVNSSWQTLGFELKIQLGNWKQMLSYTTDGKGNWFTENSSQPDFKECIDIDLPISPLTNTLPINRLQLAVGESAQIKVLYLDVLNHSIRPVDQLYTRLGKFTYRYANVPPDFEATIEVDNAGFVIDYPSLFARKHLKETSPVRSPQV